MFTCVQATKTDDYNFNYQTANNAELQGKLNALHEKINTLIAEKQRLESGKPSNDKTGCCTTITACGLSAISVAAIVSQVINEVANNGNDKKLTIISNVFDVSLIALTAIVNTFWFREQYQSRKQRKLEFDITDREQFRQFLNTIRNYQRQGSDEAWKLVEEAYKQLSDDYKQRFPLVQSSSLATRSSPNIDTRGVHLDGTPSADNRLLTNLPDPHSGNEEHKRLSVEEKKPDPSDLGTTQPSVTVDIEEKKIPLLEATPSQPGVVTTETVKNNSIRTPLRHWRVVVDAQLPHIRGALSKVTTEHPGRSLETSKAALELQFVELQKQYNALDKEVTKLERSWFNLKTRQFTTYMLTAVSVVAWGAYLTGVIWNSKEDAEDPASNFLLGTRVSFMIAMAMTSKLWDAYTDAIEKQAAFRDMFENEYSGGRGLVQFVSTIIGPSDQQSSREWLQACAATYQHLNVKYSEQLPSNDEMLCNRIETLEDDDPVKTQVAAVITSYKESGPQAIPLAPEVPESLPVLPRIASTTIGEQGARPDSSELDLAMLEDRNPFERLERMIGFKLDKVVQNGVTVTRKDYMNRFNALPLVDD